MESNFDSRNEKLNILKEMKDDVWGTKVSLTHEFEDIIDFASNKTKEELEDIDLQVSIAGRITLNRKHGKVSFLNISDGENTIQLYLKQNLLKKGVEEFSLIDLGDIIYISGSLFRTNKGELTVRVYEFDLLTKSLQNLPDKHHGVKDIEIKYRQRYLDLIANNETQNIFRNRSKIMNETRKFLEDKGFLEVETPILQTIAGGTNAKPFKTYHNSLKMDLYLRIATELYLKRLVVGGMHKVFELGKVFRNEGMSTKHNPEFTLLELYQAYSDMYDMMKITKDLIQHLGKSLGKDSFSYQGVQINLFNEWSTISMVDAVKKETGIDFSLIYSDEEAHRLAEEHNIKVQKYWKVGHILNEFFEYFVEEKLIQPTFITHHPIEISPLAKKSSDPRYTERFELFIVGREHANAFSELNDPIDQRQRFLKQLEEKDSGNTEAHEMDEDYILSLEHGMPPTGGLGIGMDRLIMLLTDQPSIRDIILFPHMRKIDTIYHD